MRILAQRCSELMETLSQLCSTPRAAVALHSFATTFISQRQLVQLPIGVSFEVICLPTTKSRARIEEPDSSRIRTILLYFTEDVQDDYLHKYDGVEATKVTAAVTDIQIVSDFNDELYFTAFTVSGTRMSGLYKTDGQNITLLRELTSGNLLPSIDDVYEFGGQLFFTATTNLSGTSEQLFFRTDGEVTVEEPSPGASRGLCRTG